MLNSFFDKLNNNNISDVVDHEFTLWNGKKKWLQVTHALISSEKNKKTVLSVFRDITQQKQNQELQKNISIAESSAKIKQQFLANMSHEMRTPMNGIIGMTSILETTPLNETQKEYLGIIQESSNTLLQLINDVLELSKIESGSILIHNDIIYTNELMKKMNNLFEPFAKKKNIDLKIIIENNFPIAFISDNVRLMQILTNLITNAIKFTKKGFVAVFLNCLQSTENELFLEVKVKDTGIGLKKESLNMIFEKFTQVDESNTRTNDGTGLGLSISKEVVKLLGGEIGVVSTFEFGSTFWFTFKAQKIEENPIILNKPLTVSEKIELKLAVLLVEDKFVNRKVAEILLKNLKCTVDIAENGAIALDKVTKNQYDIVLMDIQMPVMDGIKAVEEIRKLQIQIPVIIGLSADAMEGDNEKYINLGMDDYMTKPILPEVLKEKLNFWKNKINDKKYFKN